MIILESQELVVPGLDVPKLRTIYEQMDSSKKTWEKIEQDAHVKKEDFYAKQESCFQEYQKTVQIAKGLNLYNLDKKNLLESVSMHKKKKKKDDPKSSHDESIK